MFLSSNNSMKCRFLCQTLLQGLGFEEICEYTFDFEQFLYQFTVFRFCKHATVWRPRIFLLLSFILRRISFYFPTSMFDPWIYMLLFEICKYYLSRRIFITSYSDFFFLFDNRILVLWHFLAFTILMVVDIEIENSCLQWYLSIFFF